MSHVRWIVGGMGVGISDTEVIRNFYRKQTKFTKGLEFRDTRKEVYREALEAHHNNQQIYAERKKKSKMDSYTATGIAEGWILSKDMAEVIEAWQHLVDTGLAWQLHGSIGRAAAELIEAGVITRKVVD